MKRKTALSTLTLCIFTSAAWCDDAPKPRDRDAFRRQILDQFDADKDGRLNEDERAKAKAEFEKRRAAFANKGRDAAPAGRRPNADLSRKQIQEIVAKFDKDGDGRLNDEERAAARQAMAGKFRGQREQLMKRFDKDGDGKLSEEERAAARKAFAGQATDGRPNLDRAALMKKFDKDGNGSLDDDERAALRKHVEELRGQGRRDRPAAGSKEPAKPRVNREALKKFDADGDGKLSPDERKAAFKAIQAKKEKP